jgi:hypothetical protein
MMFCCPWRPASVWTCRLTWPRCAAGCATLVSGHESELITGLLSSLRIGGSAVAALFGNLILAPIVAYYLLLDWAGLVARTKGLIPPRWLATVQSFLDETDEVLGQYLRGQLLVMGILAVFYTVGLALVGLKLALPIGVFTGLAVFVPYLGFGLGMIMGLLAAVLEFQSVLGVAMVAAVFIVGQVLESMYITPRLLGERIGLHPIAVIFCPHGLWPPVRLCGCAGGLAGQCSAAGGDPPRQAGLSEQRAVPGTCSCESARGCGPAPFGSPGMSAVGLLRRSCEPRGMAWRPVR